MPLDITANITIPESLRRQLDPVVFQGATVKAMNRAVLSVVRRVKLNLTGRFLRVRTGRLRSSVATQVLVDGPEVVGIIGTNVFYGRIQEQGVPHPWTIRSKRQGGMLRFTAGGRTVFARQVMHPALQARPSFGTALAESRSDIIAAFQAELARAGAA